MYYICVCFYSSNYEAVEERQMVFTPIMSKHESLEIRVASEVFGRDTVRKIQ